MAKPLVTATLPENLNPKPETAKTPDDTNLQMRRLGRHQPLALNLGCQTVNAPEPLNDQPQAIRPLSQKTSKSRKSLNSTNSLDSLR